MNRKALTVGLCLFVTLRAAGATFYRLEVSHHAGNYHAAAVARLCAKPAEVYAALVDFADWPNMSPDILKATVIKKVSARSQIVYTEARGCIFFFCRELRQLRQFTERPPHDIVAVTLPGKGNVKHTSSSWDLAADGSGTRVSWQTTLEPDFWLPPLIGPSLLREVLREHGKIFIDGIERRAARGHSPTLCQRH